MPPLDLKDADHIRRLIVEPLVMALRAEMRLALRPVQDELRQIRQRQLDADKRFEQFEKRIGRIERFKTRITAVSSGIAVAAGIFWRVMIDWIR